MIKTISISARCEDLFWAAYHDENGHEVGQRDGHVPQFFPGEHDGDYVMLDIDVATGQILNWKRPSQATMEKDIEENPDD